MGHRLVRRVVVPFVLLSLVVAWSATTAGAAGPRRVVRFEGPGGGPDYATDVAAARSGFFVTGYAYGGFTSGDDYTTIGYSPNGVQRWIATYDGPDQNIDNALAVAVDPAAARVFVTGNSFGGPATINDVATVAYDAASGDELWVARYDGPGHDTDSGADVAVSPDGGTVYVGGASIGTDGSLDGLVVAYDAADGTERWAARMPGPAHDADEMMSIGVSPDGSRVFATGYRTNHTIDFSTVALGATDGTVQWDRTLEAGGDEVSRALAVSPDGQTVVVTGASSGAPTVGLALGGMSPLACAAAVGADYITTAYDASSGDRVWTSTYDGPDHDCDESFAVVVDPGGARAYVTGSSFGLTTDMDIATAAYDLATGDEAWTARWDGPAHRFDAGDSLVVTPDGGRVFVTGQSFGRSGDPDFVTVAYDAAAGTQVGTSRYNGPGDGFDAPNASAIHPSGRLLYVTGGSAGLTGVPDYATVVSVVGG